MYRVNSGLYIVATPIGNLADMSFRAVEILKSVDWVVAEDTRHSRILFQHYDIATPMSALHTHNEHAVQQQVMQPPLPSCLLAGQSTTQWWPCGLHGARRSVSVAEHISAEWLVILGQTDRVF